MRDAAKKELDALTCGANASVEEILEKIPKHILRLLVEVLHEQYVGTPENPGNLESRTLIFVATRAAAKNLSEYLNGMFNLLGRGGRWKNLFKFFPKILDFFFKIC